MVIADARYGIFSGDPLYGLGGIPNLPTPSQEGTTVMQITGVVRLKGTPHVAVKGVACMLASGCLV